MANSPKRPTMEDSLDGPRPIRHASEGLEWNMAERQFLLGPAKKSLSTERRKRVAVSIRRGRLVFVSLPVSATPTSLESTEA